LDGSGRRLEPPRSGHARRHPKPECRRMPKRDAPISSHLRSRMIGDAHRPNEIGHDAASDESRASVRA
jgi:hypothetical protein